MTTPAQHTASPAAMTIQIQIYSKAAICELRNCSPPLTALHVAFHLEAAAPATASAASCAGRLQTATAKVRGNTNKISCVCACMHVHLCVYLRREPRPRYLPRSKPSKELRVSEISACSHMRCYIVTCTMIYMMASS